MPLRQTHVSQRLLRIFDLDRNVQVKSCRTKSLPNSAADEDGNWPCLLQRGPASVRLWDLKLVACAPTSDICVRRRSCNAAGGGNLRCPGEPDTVDLDKKRCGFRTVEHHPRDDARAKVEWQSYLSSGCNHADAGYPPDMRRPQNISDQATRCMYIGGLLSNDYCCLLITVNQPSLGRRMTGTPLGSARSAPRCRKARFAGLRLR